MKKNRRKLILFDLDGTLAQSLEIGLNNMNVLRFFFGYKKLSRHDPRLRQKSGLEFVRDVLNLNIPQFAVWMQMMKFLMSLHAGNIPVYAGWKDVLEKIARDHSLGIVTSSNMKYTRTILDNARITSFGLFKTGIRYLKKDRVLREILDEENIQPSRVLYVGDELRDLEAANRVKIPFLAVNWGKDAKGVFQKSTRPPRAILEQPEDLLKYV